MTGRVLAVAGLADMFRAVTAHDRLYQRSVTVECALEVIGKETQSNLLRPAPFQLFVDAKIYQLTAKE